MKWNILVVAGKEINRDLNSSGERNLIKLKLVKSLFKVLNYGIEEIRLEAKQYVWKPRTFDF